MTDTIDWEDWCAINGALQRFADAFDRADLDDLLSLFAPDAVFDHASDHVLSGHGAIRSFLSSRLSVYAATSHHIGPPRVSRGADPSTFESVAYLIATHQLKEGRSYTGYGRYVTTLRKVDAGMLISRHAVVAHVTHGVSATVNQLARAEL